METNDILEQLSATRRALSVNEVASLLHISKQAVYRAADHIPGRFKIAGSIRFNPSALAAYLRDLGAVAKR